MPLRRAALDFLIWLSVGDEGILVVRLGAEEQPRRKIQGSP